MKKKRRINKKRIFILIFFIFLLIVSINILSNDNSIAERILPTLLKIDKLFFIPHLDPSANSFDTNPINVSINESGGIPCRKFVPAQNWLENNQTESIYQNIFINLNPQKTAIILIDLWDEDYLGDFIEHKIAPLLNLARKNNITIVHAPSQYPHIHPSISIQPEEIVISNYRYADKKLTSLGIDTLLYVGQDTLKCILDKPQGIVHTHLRSQNFKTILIRDGVFSRTSDMKTVAINMIETKFGCSITLEDLYDLFEIIPPKKIFHNVTARYNSSFDFKTTETNFKPSETALVIVNFFEDYSNKVWNNRVEKNRNEKVVPLIKLARLNNITIIYASNNDGMNNIENDYKPLPNEFVIYSEKDFRKILKEKKIKKLLYAGHALNQDILFGPAGISRLYIQARYEFNELADYYIVRDATLAFEIPETLSNEVIKKTLLKYYRNMETVTLDELPSMID